MVPPGRWFTHSFLLALKFMSVYVHRSTLPQSRFARQLPQRGSREAFPFIVPPGNRNVAGDFHRPYATQKFFTFHHSTDDTPSVTPCGRDSSLREGAGKRSHSSYRSETATLRAIFIAPTQLKNFYIPPFNGRHSLSHARWA